MSNLATFRTRVRRALADFDEATTSTLGSISGTTQANPVVVTTTAAHGLQNGNRVLLSGVTGMSELDDRAFTISNKAATTFELTGEDGSAYATPGTAGTWTLLKKPLWSDAEVDDGLRQALERYSRSNPADDTDYTELRTIENLDSADETTVLLRHEMLVARGAAGYVAYARALDVVEKIVIDSNTQSSEVIMKWCLNIIGEDDPKGEFIMGLDEVEAEVGEGGIKFVQAITEIDKYDGDWS